MKAGLLVRGLLLITFATAGSLAQSAGKQGQTPEQFDKLLAPIALYPDALVSQILTCSSSPFQVSALAEWLKANSNLKGSDLQAAAQKEGFDSSYVALAVFPQVVNMMAEQLDWTKQLGEAFRSDRSAVFDSIQRLRAQAQQVGSLQTTEQQEVETVKTDSGQQVIVIQPANPQVIYVPQYNPQTVYTTPPPAAQPAASSAPQQQSSGGGGKAVAAGLIGFTAGVVIGAAASDDHYYGPYAWRGGAYLNNDAWDDYYDHREDMLDDRSDNRQEMSENRQDAASGRQDNRTDNVDQRQAGRDQNQAGRDQNQASRQSSREATPQTSARDTRTGAEAGGRATDSTRSSSYASRGHGGTSGRGERSTAFSGYGSGSKERAASSRGHRSKSSSRSGRGRRP